MRRSVAVLLLLFGLSLNGICLAGAQEASTTLAGVPASAAQESVPRLVQFGGTLRDAAARSVSGVASVTFAIYADQDGGTALWSETQNVLSDPSGHFTVLLGSATANGVPAELFGTGQSRWLGMTIARSIEMPRVPLASVPYALKAADADTLGGLPASAYVTTQALAASNGRTLIPIIGGNTTVIATPQASSTRAVSASATDAIPQATPSGTGTTDFIPIWTSSSALGNSTIFQSAGLVGIGTTTPAETLDVNGNSIFRGSFQLPPGHPAIASSGYESHSFQFQASAFNSSTKVSDTEAFGFRAEPLNNNTTNPSAKLDLFFGSGGSAPFTDTGFSFAANGTVTFAPGQTFPGVSATVNELNLPNATNSALGVITIGGSPFVSDYGDPSNTWVGGSAGGGFKSIVPDTYNTGVGLQALYSVTVGKFNTASGVGALYLNSSGLYNAALGFEALTSNITGDFNTAVGASGGAGSNTGSYDTFLGYDTAVGMDGLTNATAIGANAEVGASNSIVLGSIAGVGNGTVNVNVGIGTATPLSTLELSSAAQATTIPAPILTLRNSAGGRGQQTAIDFLTYPPPTSGSYNPSARIEALDDGNFDDSIVFSANIPGAGNNGLFPTMSIDAYGDVEVFGDLQVDGTLDKPAGSFKIDDPIDPATKYLSHSFVESPDMKNIYDGIVVTDAKGFATVEMPLWFEALNGDFRYQLTTVGQFARAMVATELQDGRFTIQTDQPNVKVSWQVTGIRHDAWANAHRIPTEEEKPAHEQGHYLHPELFGARRDKAIAAVHHTQPANANEEASAR